MPRKSKAEKTAKRQLPKELEEHSWKKGQSGNPTGRPKGVRNKLSEDFLGDFHDAWLEHGNESLRKMATEKPAEFVKAAVQLMPKDLHVKADASDAFVKIWEAISENRGNDGLENGMVTIEEQPVNVRSSRTEGRAGKLAS